MDSLSNEARGPIYKGVNEEYHSALSDVQLVGLGGKTEGGEHGELKTLPKGFHLGLITLERALAEVLDNERSGEFSGLNIASEQNFPKHPFVRQAIRTERVYSAIQPDNLMNAYIQEGLTDLPVPVLSVPLADGGTIYIPGNFNIHSSIEQDRNSFVDSTIQIPLLIEMSDSRLYSYAIETEQTTIRDIKGKSEERVETVPDLVEIIEPKHSRFLGWNEQVVTHLRATSEGVKSGEIGTADERLNKYIHVAQGVLADGFKDMAFSRFFENTVLDGEEVSQFILDQISTLDPKKMRSVFLERYGSKAKSIDIIDPVSGRTFTVSILEKCNVDVGVQGQRGIRYYFHISTLTSEDPDKVPIDRIIGVERRINENDNSHTMLFQDLGSFADHYSDPWGTRVQVEPAEVLKGSEYKIINAENYAQHIIDRLPDVKELVALQAMKIKVNQPGISELVEALIKKKETDPDVDIVIAVSKDSVSSLEDANTVNRMIRAGIRFKWTDQHYEHPYSGYNHRKLFVLDEEVGIGGTNLEGDSLLFVDWMISYTNNPVLREVIIKKILEESEPYRMREMEFELFEMTPGRESFVPTDSKVDLEKFVDSAFEGERMGFISENAYTDKESALIEAAVMAINRAERSIVIMGQWLPDGKVREALVAALLRNPDLKVEIISNSGRSHLNEAIPHRNPRDKIVYGSAYYITQFLLTRSISRLFKNAMHKIDGRLRIHTTDKKLVHAKQLLVDDEVLIIGSDNFIQSGANYRTREAGMIISVESIVRSMRTRIRGALRKPFNWSRR